MSPAARGNRPRGNQRAWLLLAASLWAPTVDPGSARAGRAEQRLVTCAACHETQAASFNGSIHAGAGLDCRACHGGADRYSVEPIVVQRLRRLASQPVSSVAEGPAAFDHGTRFRGKAARNEVPERCGTCHADVSAMNPYGLPTDQLAQYRISGHGRALYERSNPRVAVCIDCHGAHDVVKIKDRRSPVYPVNVPATCGRCHDDLAIMGEADLSLRVVAEYRLSVHGKGLLEGGDAAMPQCATCHGSHSAVPPGYSEVGHVCGRCHQQEEQHFLQSPHRKFPLFPRCVACHTESFTKRDHRIVRVATSPETLEEAYRRVRASHAGLPPDERKLAAAFAERRHPPVNQYEAFCHRCHQPSAQRPHSTLFTQVDERANRAGQALYRFVRRAELRYAATSVRVADVGRGVLLVTDEALKVEVMRTKLVELGPLQHSLDPAKLETAVGELDGLADEVDRALDAKLRELRWRYWALLPMWGFVALFVGALWVKYKRLKAVWVRPLPE